MWQTDFSEFETIAGGTWRITGVVDYAAKLCFACHANGTQTGRDAVTVLEAAIAEAETLLGEAHSKTTSLIPEAARSRPSSWSPTTPRLQVRSLRPLHAEPS